MPICKLMSFSPCAAFKELEGRTAAKRLAPKITAGVDDILDFIVRGCSSEPTLCHIFNLSVC